MEHCASLEIVKSKGRGRSRGQEGSSRDLETWNQEPKGTLLAQRAAHGSVPCTWQQKTEAEPKERLEGAQLGFS